MKNSIILFILICIPYTVFCQNVDFISAYYYPNSRNDLDMTQSQVLDSSYMYYASEEIVDEEIRYKTYYQYDEFGRNTEVDRFQ